jgi:hypothetical protein
MLRAGQSQTEGVVGQPAFVERPANTVARVSDRVELACRLGNMTGMDAVQWLEFATNPTKETLVSENDSLITNSGGRYAISTGSSNETSRFNLVIRRASLSDGAKYVCRSKLYPSVQRAAWLTILGEYQVTWFTFQLSL